MCTEAAAVFPLRKRHARAGLSSRSQADPLYRRQPPKSITSFPETVSVSAQRRDLAARETVRADPTLSSGHQPAQRGAARCQHHAHRRFRSRTTFRLIAGLSGRPSELRSCESDLDEVHAVGTLLHHAAQPGLNKVLFAQALLGPLDLAPGAQPAVPDGSVIAVLVNPDNPPSAAEGTAAQMAAAALGQPLLILNASTQGHIEDAFATIKQQQVRALIVSSDPFFFSERLARSGASRRFGCAITAGRRSHR
jgi:hypothetical protein